jgi:peptidoglycan hydrolase-like protein with peptidoglycan-binding domain
VRGGGASVALVALAIAVLGGGAAVAQQAVTSQQAPAGMLAKGSQGEAVKAVQTKLGIAADGVFGESMDAAVKRFQRQHGLLVDGIVGPQTRAALGLGAQTGASAQGSAQGAGAASGAPAAGGTAPAGLEQIAQCESGGNPRAIGGGGQFRGKYQFTRETWAAVGGTGDPAAASEAEQDARAAALYRRSGTSSWPTCGG